jgi:teichuronic acid biosynthesis glycosyltransferase TuaG
MQAQLEHMKVHDLSFSWTGYKVVDQNGELIRNEEPPAHMTRWEMLCKKGTIGCLTATFDKDRLDAMQMLPFPLRQDFILWNDIMLKCDEQNLNYGGISDLLAVYRVHSDGISADKKKAARMQWKAYRGPIGLSFAKSAYAFSAYASEGVRSRLR